MRKLYSKLPILTKPQRYTLIITGVTANPTKGGSITRDIAYWWRVGPHMHIQYSYEQTAGGTAGTGIYLFGIPSGFQIDSNFIPAVTDTSQGLCGVASANGGTLSGGYVKVYNGTNLEMVTWTDTVALQAISDTFYALSNASQRYSFYAVVPIAGWGFSR